MDNFNLQKWVAKRASSLQSNRPADDGLASAISIKQAVNEDRQEDMAAMSSYSSRARQTIPPLSSVPPMTKQATASASPNIASPQSIAQSSAQPSVKPSVAVPYRSSEGAAMSSTSGAQARVPVLKAGERLGSKSTAEKDIRTGKARNLYAKEPPYSAAMAKLSAAQVPVKPKTPPTIKNETKILNGQGPAASVTSAAALAPILAETPKSFVETTKQDQTLAQALKTSGDAADKIADQSVAVPEAATKTEAAPKDTQKEDVTSVVISEKTVETRSESAVRQSAETQKTESAQSVPVIEEKAQSETQDEISQIAQKIQEKIEERLLNEKSSLAELVQEDEKSSPLHQIQIVKLLSDLGERLRKSEREREILWKEVETCRKQIDGLGEKNTKAEEAYKNLQQEASDKEVQIKSLVEKQTELNELLSTQKTQFEAGQAEQNALKAKLEEKLTSLETSTGSAIVRVEDAIAENTKLSKRVEQLGQDKARLLHKLDLMEETLTQTQDALKAKALVLLTDQAIAAQTNLPQTPAWSGDDTLKLSAVPQEGRAENLAVGIATSFRPDQRARAQNKAFLAALLILGMASGVLLGVIGQNYFGQAAKDSAAASPIPTEQKKTLESQLLDPRKIELNANEETEGQTALMGQIATLANQIEPGSAQEKSSTPQSLLAAKSLDVIGSEQAFESALKAQNLAVKEFKQKTPKTPPKERIQPDQSLPDAAKSLEEKAFANNAAVQYQLANLYATGKDGVTENHDRAAKWFFEAAHHDIAAAQFNLAVLTGQGVGVSKDAAASVNLYRVASANHYPQADYNLAIAYIDGVGVEYNPIIAANYFQRAAAGGMVEAAYNLGLLNENGLLGESQPDEAVFWYGLAAQSGNVQASDALRDIKKQLSLSDEDAANIMKKMAQSHPAFMNDRGEAALPASHSKS
ncbi:MAG: SEL1-like repeat protein [Alphaproteobacteria bacterium]|nr:SEL1-like repeat protein [Alphaproteobacteria bacterium]